MGLTQFPLSRCSERPSYLAGAPGPPAPGDLMQPADSPSGGGRGLSHPAGVPGRRQLSRPTAPVGLAQQVWTRLGEGPRWYSSPPPSAQSSQSLPQRQGGGSGTAVRSRDCTVRACRRQLVALVSLLGRVTLPHRPRVSRGPVIRCASGSRRGGETGGQARQAWRAQRPRAHLGSGQDGTRAEAYTSRGAHRQGWHGASSVPDPLGQCPSGLTPVWSGPQHRL